MDFLQQKQEEQEGDHNPTEVRHHHRPEGHAEQDGLHEAQLSLRLSGGQRGPRQENSTHLWDDRSVSPDPLRENLKKNNFFVLIRSVKKFSLTDTARQFSIETSCDPVTKYYRLHTKYLQENLQICNTIKIFAIIV